MHVNLLLSRLHWLKASECIAYKVAVFVAQMSNGLVPVYLCGRHMTTTLRLINVSGCSTHDRAFPVAATHLWNSFPLHDSAAPLSPSSALVLSHVCSHFLIPLSDSSFICTLPTQ